MAGSVHAGSPSPREAAGRVGVGGVEAVQAASGQAATPPTPSPSPPRAMRAGGGERTPIAAEAA